jgi:hypothetical protein
MQITKINNGGHGEVMTGPTIGIDFVSDALEAAESPVVLD